MLNDFSVALKAWLKVGQLAFDWTGLIEIRSAVLNQSLTYALWLQLFPFLCSWKYSNQIKANIILLLDQTWRLEQKARTWFAVIIMLTFMVLFTSQSYCYLIYMLNFSYLQVCHPKSESRSIKGGSPEKKFIPNKLDIAVSGSNSCLYWVRTSYIVKAYQPNDLQLVYLNSYITLSLRRYYHTCMHLLLYTCMQVCILFSESNNITANWYI